MFNPEGSGGSTADYIDWHIQEAFKNIKIRVADRNTLKTITRTRILQTALYPQRELQQYKLNE